MYGGALCITERTEAGYSDQCKASRFLGRNQKRVVSLIHSKGSGRTFLDFCLSQIKATQPKMASDRHLHLSKYFMTNELKTAIRIIKKTNSMLKKEFKRKGIDALKLKNGSEIVTEMDIKINNFIVGELQKAFPNHSIISEEGDKIDNGNENVWHVDPIDGTTNFSVGFPEFATCLSLSQNNNLALGIVGLPYMDEICFAQKNTGAICLSAEDPTRDSSEEKINVSNKKELKGSFLMFCAGHGKEGRDRYNIFYEKIKNIHCRFRMFSSAGIELSAVANGQVDGCVITDINDWDVAAGAIIIREAGGKVTNFRGKDWQLGDRTFVASNGLIHDEIIKFTKEAI